MTTLFHVSSVRNRSSILAHGLDSTRMGAARGIAGSRRPEVDGVFLCLGKREAQWFIQMNNTGGHVDLWKVTGVDLTELVESPEGHHFVRRHIPATQVELYKHDIAPDSRPAC